MDPKNFGRAPTGDPPPRSSLPGTAGDTLAHRVRASLRLWRLYWLRLQLRLAPTESQRLFALTLLLGVVCGLVAVAFHLAIQLAERQLIERALAAPGRAWIAWTVLTPTLGGLTCGALLTWVFPNARGSGIPQVKMAFALRDGRLRFADAAGKFAVGTLQIGAGASLGREGPTVQICAGVASALSGLVGVSPRSLRRLLPVGAAAGVAAAFNAPMAAVTFTVEEIVGDLDRSVLSGAIVAAALAAVIERSVLGEHPFFSVPSGYGLHHASSLLIYAALGLAAGLLSVAFTDALLSTRRWFRALRVIPRWAQPAVGGAVTGALAVAAIQLLRVQGVTGGGYAALGRTLLGQLPVVALLTLCAMKVVATVASYSSGGAGGIFAPSLFVGATLGGAFGALDVRVFGPGGDALGAFAVVGMGAAFSGIIRAPLTSVLIILEMTGSYALILPLMIANMTSYLIARTLRPATIYDALLAQDGVRLYDRALADALESVPVGDVLRRDAAPVAFSLADSMETLVRARCAQEIYPVTDAAGRVLGIITDEELALLAREPSLDALVTASDLMRPTPTTRLRDDLHVVLAAMLQHRLPRIPVVDDGGALVGLIDEASVARAYLRHRTASPE